MMCRTRIFAIVAFAMLVAFDSAAVAAPISKCSAAKKKCIGKYVAAVLQCHAKAERKGTPVDHPCLNKARAKITNNGKGCFERNDARFANDCVRTGDAAQQLADADTFVLDIVADIDPGFPTPSVSTCGAARKKCAGRKAYGLMSCSARANKDGIGDPACAPKVQDKFGGCDVKALAQGTDCLGTATTASLEAKIDAWNVQSADALDNPAPICGNGVIDPGEFCDPAAPFALEGACGPEFTCHPFTCNCECPASLSLTPDDPESIDVGWTGLAHAAPVITNADLTLGVSGCAGSEHPCGTCNLVGPIPNVRPNQLRSQRCTNDTSIQCTDDTPCTGGGGTCQFFLGSAFPLTVGGVATCTVSQIVGSISGTTNFETGTLATALFVSSRVHSGFTVDAPCPRCEGDANRNDGESEGICNGGPRDGQACDANGGVPDRPDFGSTSLDCPPNPGALLATLPIDLSTSTAGESKTLSSASPACSGELGERCLCDTCNNANAEPCDDNADCPVPPGPIGAVCGGRRCIGGGNLGTPCTINSECPGGGVCARPGEPTKPSACLDDTLTVGLLDCADVGSGRTECTMGPIDQTCSIASGHAQRGCLGNGDCGGGAGSCESSNRRCFLTGGLTGKNGTNTLVADGMAGTPIQGASIATLGGVTCVGPTASAAVNTVIGLPGSMKKQLSKGSNPQPPTPQPEACYSDRAVGVIPQLGFTCPGRFVGIHTHNEQDGNISKIAGWTGVISNDPLGTAFGFCRVDGTLFNKVSFAPYAVLKLGNTCPTGSFEAEHRFDTENINPFNFAVGNILPSIFRNQLHLSYVHMLLCVFQAGGLNTTFPNLHFPYGVFAPPHSAWLDSGHGRTDDEDKKHFGPFDEVKSYDAGELHPTIIYTSPGGGDRLNSEYNTAKVRNDPCDPCPYVGSFDTQHCYIGTPPTGETAFLSGGNLYFTPVGTNGCPYPGIYFVNGIGCFVMTPPSCSHPFIWSNNWYVEPACH